MKKVFYLIITTLLFIPVIANAKISTITTCDNPVYDENHRQVKTCYLDLEVSGNHKFQTVKGTFTLTNTAFKNTPVATDARITVTDNGNNNYSFSAKSPIANQTVRLAKFTIYLATNGQYCSIVWKPGEFTNSYCEFKDGNYYDLNGNIVSKTEYSKQCEKHYCEVIDGTYFGKDGSTVSATDYKKQCEKHYCEVIDGTYFDKSGNVVSADAYKKSCEPEQPKPEPEKHYCEVVDGKYYDKNGNEVSKADYDTSCSTPICKIVDGTYYDASGNAVTEAEYDKQCNVHYCKIVDGTYFGKNGNAVDKSIWETECTTVVPDTGGFFSASTAVSGLILLAGIAIVTKKVNKVKKI